MTHQVTIISIRVTVTAQKTAGLEGGRDPAHTHHTFSQQPHFIIPTGGKIVGVDLFQPSLHLR